MFWIYAPNKWQTGLGVVRSLASDGQYLYLYSSRGLFKIGSGHGGTIKGHIYYCVPDFFHDDKGWLGFANVSRCTNIMIDR